MIIKSVSGGKIHSCYFETFGLRSNFDTSNDLKSQKAPAIISQRH